jgi:HEAT repeat protein
MPDAYRLIVPLLSSPDPQELRHGAALLGRLRQPQGVAKLAPLVSHADPRVRAAAVRGIGRIHRGPAAEPLREALHHPDPRTRIAAAEAIAEWRAGALALLLVARLPVERDREVWQGMITALGAIGTAESCAALAGVATARRTLLRRDGYDTGQRVVAIRALGLSGSDPARAALERLERAGDAPVREAAARLLDRARRRAG